LRTDTPSEVGITNSVQRSGDRSTDNKDIRLKRFCKWLISLEPDEL